MPTPHNTLHFINPGEIDPDLFKLFGVSAKENDNPVGFFGTGLKYAIAILLREHHTITIFSGLDEYNFTTEPRTYRGSTHNIVLCNGEPLSFTLDLGKNWQLWQASRELYSNCVLDENGAVSIGLGEPRSDYTVIRVTGRQFLDAHHDRGNIFLEGTPVFADSDIELYEGSTKNVYYRGIKVYELPEPTAFRYNLITSQQLTEDRTLQSLWDLNWHGAYTLVTGTHNRDIIRRGLTSVGYERDNFNLERYTKCTDEFLEVAREVLRTCPTDIAHPQVARAIAKHSKETLWTAVEPTAQMRSKLQKSIAICRRLGTNPEAFPVIIANNLGQNILGRAHNRQILLSDRVFDLGTKQVAATLYEETIHLERGYADCTRQMQDFLFNKIFTMYEEITGEDI